MATLGTNFKGSKQDKTAIRSTKYTILACNSSDFTRGSLFEDGSLLYIMGVSDGVNYVREPDISKEIGLSVATWSRKASMSATVYADTTEKALQELESSKITLFVVDSNQLIGLSGFAYSAADFTSIEGILNAEYIFDGVTPSITRSSKGDSIDSFTLSVNINNRVNLYSKIYQDEPIGTYIAFWDFVASNSKVDSVNSLTLTDVGTPTYSTDHYDIDGATSNGFLINNFASGSTLDISKKSYVAVYLDWLDNGTGSKEVIFTLGDGTLFFNLETHASNNGIYVTLRTSGGSHGIVGDYIYTSSTRKALIAYVNFEKNILKIIDSSDEQERAIPVTSALPKRMGGFTGADNDLYIGLVQDGSAGADVNIYKLGISSG